MIKIQNLTKTYSDNTEEVVALNDVSFEIDDNEDVAIIGPSGSGKTTLLELMAGLNNPTSGSVIINDVDIHTQTDDELSHFRNKKIGFIFQMMHLQDYFTALENVTLPLIAAGVNQENSNKRAKELLDRVGLSDRETHYPKQLSGGEMQRVSIARALANKPKIIMADEPTAKLDKKNIESVMNLFKEISTDEGLSFLLITHDERIAKKYKRQIRLENGQLVN